MQLKPAEISENVKANEEDSFALVYKCVSMEGGDLLNGNRPFG